VHQVGYLTEINTSDVLFPGFRNLSETLPSLNTNIDMPSAAKRMVICLESFVCI
jgi:hypothetical protein